MNAITVKPLTVGARKLARWHKRKIIINPDTKFDSIKYSTTSSCLKITHLALYGNYLPFQQVITNFSKTYFTHFNF